MLGVEGGQPRGVKAGQASCFCFKQEEIMQVYDRVPTQTETTLWKLFSGK